MAEGNSSIELVGTVAKRKMRRATAMIVVLTVVVLMHQSAEMVAEEYYFMTSDKHLNPIVIANGYRWVIL